MAPPVYRKILFLLMFYRCAIPGPPRLTGTFEPVSRFKFNFLNEQSLAGGRPANCSR
jgi:hypothetical protein